MTATIVASRARKMGPFPRLQVIPCFHFPPLPIACFNMASSLISFFSNSARDASFAHHDDPVAHCDKLRHVGGDHDNRLVLLKESRP